MLDDKKSIVFPFFLITSTFSQNFIVSQFRTLCTVCTVYIPMRTHEYAQSLLVSILNVDFIQYIHYITIVLVLSWISSLEHFLCVLIEIRTISDRFALIFNCVSGQILEDFRLMIDISNGNIALFNVSFKFQSFNKLRTQNLELRTQNTFIGSILQYKGHCIKILKNVRTYT